MSQPHHTHVRGVCQPPGNVLHPLPLHRCRFECSALTRRSLRREVLCLLSAASRAMADPAALLAQALDAPEAAVVAAALQYLQEVRWPRCCSRQAC
jgi:hypothetical protein